MDDILHPDSWVCLGETRRRASPPPSSHYHTTGARPGRPISSSTIADRPPNRVKIEVRSALFLALSSHIDACPERTVHTKSRRYTLDPAYSPTFSPSLLSLPPASATADLRILIAILLLNESNTPVLFATLPFSHGCPTRARRPIQNMLRRHILPGIRQWRGEKSHVEARLARMRFFVPPSTA